MEKVYGVNPQTGEKIYKTKRVLTYGISDAEYSVIESNLPSKDIDLFDCTDCFADIIALSFIAVIINPDTASSEDLDMFNSFYSNLIYDLYCVQNNFSVSGGNATGRGFEKISDSNNRIKKVHSFFLVEELHKEINNVIPLLNQNTPIDYNLLRYELRVF